MAKLYLTQNQQNQRPFSEKEGMWVKREFFTNCKSREKTHFGQFFVFFPLPRAREGGGGYSHTLPVRVCAAQRGRDFEAHDLERGIHFRGVF